MNPIDQTQQEIIYEFDMFNGDMEKTLFFLIAQGKNLPPFPAADKTDDSLIKGCHSKVWLTAVSNKGQVYFQGDSNTAITRGLISLLIRILNGQSPQAIVKADLSFMHSISLELFYW